MIIDQTKSVCPICFKDLSANIISKKNKVFLEKECNNHGKFCTKIADNVRYFKKLRKIYFKNKNKKSKIRIYDLYVNQKCNLKCPICYVDTHKRVNFEPKLNDIKKKLIKIKNCDINLLGGEPTLRKDLNEIINIIEQSGNNAVLFTNGIKLTDINYCKELKQNGLKDVRFSFEGFNDNAYKKIRGAKLTNIKIKALNNLSLLSIPTLMEVTVVKGINGKELIKILDYAINNKNIKAISFRSITELGKNTYKRRCTVDEMLSILEKETHKKIRQKDVFNFQKYFYYLSNLLKIKECFYNKYYLLFRTKKGYVAFNDVFNLDTNYEKEIGFIDIIGKIFQMKILTLTPLFFKMLLKKNLNLKDINDILLLRFGDSCDPYTFDYNNAKNCPGLEINFKDQIYKTTALSNISKDKELKCSVDGV